MRERALIGRLPFLAVVVAVLLVGCGGVSGTTPHRLAAPASVPLQTHELSSVAFQHVPGPPFGVATTPDGRYAFVDLVDGRVLVYLIADHVPRLVRTLRVPGEAVGSSITRDGRLLLVADGSGAAVVSVARAETGAAHPVLGVLSPPRSAPGLVPSAIETASSASGRYVFVSLEYGQPDGEVVVYDMGSDRTPRFGPKDYAGSIKLGQAVVGSALSPRGKYLYVTSEGAGRSRTADGTLSVINVKTAEQDPDRAVMGTVPAGIQPVRVAVSPNGSTVWVTARASNRVLAFSAQRLITDPSKAKIAEVKVGAAPVGIAVFDDGAGLIVDDSDRFDARGAHPGLTIINTKDALAKRKSVIAAVRSGQFPREVAVEGNGLSALVTNFGSDQLETVTLGQRKS